MTGGNNQMLDNTRIAPVPRHAIWRKLKIETVETDTSVYFLTN